MHYLQNMGIKQPFFIIVLFFVILPFLSATCKKNKGECIGNAYSLKETWNVLPQKDSISIGDTLIFSSNFSNRPFDYNTNTNVDFSGSGLVGTSFSIRIVKGYNDLKPAIDSFSLFLLEGKYNDNDLKPTQIKDIFWVESNSTYKIKIGIIARKKGDYSITTPDAIGRLKKANECENGAGIILSNSNVKNNAYLSHPYYGLPYVPGTDSTHIFCIRVK
jgi:hypothetical protein